MKVVFDSNIYISWIREHKNADLLLDVGTQKYLSCYVLMELWAGAITKKGVRVVEKLQKPYLKANRVIELRTDNFITAGQLLSDVPKKQRSRLHDAGFINDVLIAVSAVAIGATLYTMNKADFTIIRDLLQGLKVVYV